MKKLLLLILCALSLNSLAQTTSWSSSPPVTIQTRILSGSPQVRIIWTPSYIFSLSDSLNYLKGLFSGYQPLSAKLTSISALANAAGVLTNNGSGVFSYTTPTAGTVTTLTDNTANGVAITWANRTTTPTPTVVLGAITPTSTNGVSAATMAFNDATSSIQTQLNGKAPAVTYTSNTIYKGNGTTTPIVSSLTDDGSTVTSSNLISAPQYIATGNVDAFLAPSGSNIYFGKASFTNAFAWMGSNGHVGWLSLDNITGNNRYYMPDLDGKTLATIDGNQTFTSLNISGLSTFNNTQYIAGASGQSIAYFNGDSYTLIPGITATNSWVQLTAVSKNIFIQNNAVSGSQVADQTTFIYGRTTVNTSVNFHQLGTNDLTIFLTDTAKQTAFRYALRANLFYMAVPNTKKILGTAASLTGTWTNTPVYGIGKTSTVSGSTATATISGSTVLVAIQQGFTGYGGTATVTIDGTGYGTFSGATSVDITTQGGRAYSPKLLKFTGLANTSHTVVIATTNNSPFYLDWVAGIDGTTLSPRTYVGNIPYRTAGGYSSFGGSNALVDTYNAIISGVVSEVSGLGGSISLADINAVINPATDISGDGLHPNNAGQIKMANTYIAAYVANTSNIGFYGTQFLYNTGNASAGVFSTTSSIFANSYNIDHPNKFGISLNGVSKFVLDGTNITVSESLLPTASSTYNLGSSGLRWGTMFIGAINVSSTSTMAAINSGAITTTGDIKPSANNAYSFGSSSVRYGTSFFNVLNIVGAITSTSSATFDGNGDFGGATGNGGVIARGANSGFNGFRVGNSAGTNHWLMGELAGASGQQGDFLLYDLPANIPFLTITKTTGVASFYSSLAIGGPLNLKNYTVATLPTGSLGDTAVVTDALAPTYGAAVVGTGTVVTTVLKNATTWVVN